MHGLNLAGEQDLQPARAAFHVDDFDLEPFLLIKTAGLRHPDRKDGHDRRRYPDLEGGELGGFTGRRQRDERDCNAQPRC